MIEFDQRNLEQAARAVIKFNKHMADDTVDDVVRQMMQDARTTFFRQGEVGYLSIRGYVLTVFHKYGDPSQGRACFASIAPSLVDPEVTSGQQEKPKCRTSSTN